MIIHIQFNFWEKSFILSIFSCGRVLKESKQSSIFDMSPFSDMSYIYHKGGK